MQETSVRFQNKQDAQKVAAQLPDARIDGVEIVCSDKRALQTAINLSEVAGYTCYSNQRCPVEEREYSGDKPQIYVACLSAYTSGYLHGLWIDATQDADLIQQDVDWMLSFSPVAHREACEEWAIHDWEGFGGFSLREYESLEVISAVAKAIAEHGEAFGAYVEAEFPAGNGIDWDKAVDMDWETVIERFTYAFMGHFNSEKDFVMQSEEIEEMYQFKELERQFPFWARNIDWEGVAIDLFCSEYYSIKASDKGYGVYILRSHVG